MFLRPLSRQVLNVSKSKGFIASTSINSNANLTDAFSYLQLEFLLLQLGTTALFFYCASLRRIYVYFYCDYSLDRGRYISSHFTDLMAAPLLPLHDYTLAFLYELYQLTVLSSPLLFSPSFFPQKLGVYTLAKYI